MDASLAILTRINASQLFAFMTLFFASSKIFKSDSAVRVKQEKTAELSWAELLTEICLIRYKGSLLLSDKLVVGLTLVFVKASFYPEWNSWSCPLLLYLCSWPDWCLRPLVWTWHFVQSWTSEICSRRRLKWLFSLFMLLMYFHKSFSVLLHTTRKVWAVPRNRLFFGLPFAITMLSERNILKF